MTGSREHIFVIFSDGAGWCGWLVRRLTRFPLGHVSVSWGGRVLTTNIVRLFGNREKVYDLNTVLDHAKSIRCVFWVPVAALPPAPAARITRTSAISSFVRWATRGRTKANDCVSVVVESLKKAGISLPRGTLSPRDLHRWLETQGYEHAAFDQGTAHPACGYPVCSLGAVCPRSGEEDPTSRGDEAG